MALLCAAVLLAGGAVFLALRLRNRSGAPTSSPPFDGCPTTPCGLSRACCTRDQTCLDGRCVASAPTCPQCSPERRKTDPCCADGDCCCPEGTVYSQGVCSPPTGSPACPPCPVGRCDPARPCCLSDACCCKEGARFDPVSKGCVKDCREGTPDHCPPTRCKDADAAKEGTCCADDHDVCCSETEVASGGQCYRSCGDFLCTDASTCAEVQWSPDKLAELGIRPCPPDSKGKPVENCLAGQKGDSVYVCLTQSECTLSEPDYLPVQPLTQTTTNFKPAFVMDAGRKQGDVWLKDAAWEPDCYRALDGGGDDHFGSKHCMIDEIRQKLAASASTKAVLESYTEDALSEPFRDKFQSPYGYACLGDGEIGWRWEFRTLSDRRGGEDVCGPQQCFNPMLSDPDTITRAWYFEEAAEKTCVFEKCLGKACKDQGALRCEDGSAPPCTGKGPVAAADDACGGGEPGPCGAQANICNAGCLAPDLECLPQTNGAGGKQIWPKGAGELNLCWANCADASNMWLADEAGDLSDRVDWDSGRWYCKDPVDAFDWYDKNHTAHIGIINSGQPWQVKYDQDPKIAAPGKKALNPARGKHTADVPAVHHVEHKVFTFADYSQNINLHYNGCGHADSCRGSRDDKPEC